MRTEASTPERISSRSTRKHSASPEGQLLARSLGHARSMARWPEWAAILPQAPVALPVCGGSTTKRVSRKAETSLRVRTWWS